jgi:hypothetical protein
LRRLQRSASQPAGNEKMPNAKNDAVFDGEADHDGRKDQHHIVIEPMRKIHEADRDAPSCVIIQRRA